MTSRIPVHSVHVQITFGCRQYTHTHPHSRETIRHPPSAPQHTAPTTAWSLLCQRVVLCYSSQLRRGRGELRSARGSWGNFKKNVYDKGKRWETGPVFTTEIVINVSGNNLTQQTMMESEGAGCLKQHRQKKTLCTQRFLCAEYQ